MSHFQKRPRYGFCSVDKDSGLTSKPSQLWLCYQSPWLSKAETLWVLWDGYWMFWLEIHRAGHGLSERLWSLKEASLSWGNGVSRSGLHCCLLVLILHVANMYACQVTNGLPSKPRVLDGHNCLLRLSVLKLPGLGKAIYIFGFLLSYLIGEDFQSLWDLSHGQKPQE